MGRAFVRAKNVSISAGEGPVCGGKGLDKWKREGKAGMGCIVLYPPARQTGKPVEVVYTERTVFLIRAPWDGRGVTDREGTAADLEKGSRILLSGVREGDVLYASRIVITGF